MLSPVSSASTSSRGVTKHSITVVFPVVSLNSLAGREGFAEDAEYGEQTKAIKLFVNQINEGGGINGRKIDPIISNYDPTNETQMRSLCKTWTQGSPAAFTVLDGLGAWTGDNQLCVTQEGHTPLHRRVVHGHQLDQGGLALPVVDRSRPGDHPAGRGELGTERPPDRRHRSRSGSSPAAGPRTRSPSTPISCPISAAPVSTRS